MKSGLATSLSLVGVLATGGAALVLNSSILDTASATKGSPALATVVGLESDLGTSAVGGSVSASGAAAMITGSGAGEAPPAPPKMIETGDERPVVAPSTTPPATPTTSAAPVDRQFKVADIATVTLTITGTQLTVKSVVFASGSDWKVTNKSSNDGDDVRISLASPTSSTEFSARLVNGQVVAAIGSPSSGNLMPPPPPRHDDGEDQDDDGDGRDGREHRDGHEQREHEREDDDD